MSRSLGGLGLAVLVLLGVHAERGGAPLNRSGGLEILKPGLPDGSQWILGPKGIGRPFRVRLTLSNVSDGPIALWDLADSEGSES
ncbi:MAG: hypothetical protein AB7I30_03110, partial [Isosphaeraceae bacterium]